MRIALLQWDTAWEEPEANFDRVRELMDDLFQDDPPDFVSLPELFATGFSMNVEELAEDRNGPTHEFLQTLARNYDTHVQGAAMQKAGDGKRAENTALIYQPDGGLICRYAKVHPFSYADEDRYYKPGTEVKTIDLFGFTICPVICYDLRFPELFRAGVDQGADLFLVPANWPSERLDHWRALLRARAIENQAYIAAANRTGEGGGLSYPGHSTIVSPWGEVVEELNEEEGVLLQTLSIEEVTGIRKDYPFLQDRTFDIQT